MDEMQTQRVARMIGQAIINEGFSLTVSQAVIDDYALDRGYYNADKGMRGRTDFVTRSVVVGELPSWDLAQVLAHELAHVLLHGPRGGHPRQFEWQAELEAESVAHNLLDRFGVADHEWSANYIGQYLSELPSSEWDRAIRASASTIRAGTDLAFQRVALTERRAA